MRVKRRRDFKMVIFILMLFSLTVGYSMVTVNLSINGRTRITKTTWDVHLANLEVDSGSVVAETSAEIDKENPTQINYKVSLEEPGDYYKFGFDVINNGTINAMVNNVKLEDSLKDTNQDFYEYRVEYDDGNEVLNKDGLASGESQRINVIVKYKEVNDFSDLIATDTVRDLNLNLEYTQADANANYITPTMKNISLGGYDDLVAYNKVISSITLNNKIEIPDNATKVWDVSEKQDNSVMAYIIPNTMDSSLYDLHIEGKGGIMAPQNSSRLFTLRESGYVNYSTTAIDGLQYLNTSRVSDMSYMFYGFSNVGELDVSHFDTRNVVNMDNMFSGDLKVTNLDLSNFDTRKVTNMNAMFRSCQSIETLDLNNFNTSLVTTMAQMFQSCSKLNTLKIDNFNTSKVGDMSYMFESTTRLTSLNVKSFNTENVTNMSHMFDGAYVTDLDLSSFVTPNLQNMDSMFTWMGNNLKTIDISNMTFDKVTSCEDVFLNTSTKNIMIVVKDSTAKEFITARLQANSKTANVVTMS